MSLIEVQNEKMHRNKGSFKHELEEVWKDCSEHIILMRGMSWPWYLGEVTMQAKRHLYPGKSLVPREKPCAQRKLSIV